MADPTDRIIEVGPVLVADWLPSIQVPPACRQIGMVRGHALTPVKLHSNLQKTAPRKNFAKNFTQKGNRKCQK